MVGMLKKIIINQNFYLIKDFKFKNFQDSQKFVNKVGSIAEMKIIILIFFLAGDMQK